MKRPRQAMPADVERALAQRRLIGVYRDRPAYQQNDYIGWITHARREDTRHKRLAQMLEELQQGGVYMGMAHPPSRRRPG
jgi:uncharacterized protein YdeI (YjbR/CyaY-like superfamily)